MVKSIVRTPTFEKGNGKKHKKAIKNAKKARVSEEKEKSKGVGNEEKEGSEREAKMEERENEEDAFETIIKLLDTEVSKAMNI
jgi:hypothetical protein